MPSLPRKKTGRIQDDLRELMNLFHRRRGLDRHRNPHSPNLSGLRSISRAEALYLCPEPDRSRTISTRSRHGVRTAHSRVPVHKYLRIHSYGRQYSMGEHKGCPESGREGD